MQPVINTPGTFISQKDGCLRLKQEERRLDVAPLKALTLVIFNRAMISSHAVVMAVEHNIDVIFLDVYGHPVGQIWFSQPGLRRVSPVLDLLSFENPRAFAHSLALSPQASACKLVCGAP
jgi:CRISPR/Cas system-associated endonuclease Cas1